MTSKSDKRAAMRTAELLEDTPGSSVLVKKAVPTRLLRGYLLSGRLNPDRTGAINIVHCVGDVDSPGIVVTPTTSRILGVMAGNASLRLTGEVGAGVYEEPQNFRNQQQDSLVRPHRRSFVNTTGQRRVLEVGRALRRDSTGDVVRPQWAGVSDDGVVHIARTVETAEELLPAVEVAGRALDLEPRELARLATIVLQRAVYIAGPPPRELDGKGMDEQPR